MLELISEYDTIFFLFLNSFHSDATDWLMVWISDDKIWIPFYLLLIFFIFKTLKNTRKSIVTVVLLIISVVAADSFTSKVMKPYFERPRPSHTTALENQIHLVDNYRGGQFGFASSHAANTFALAMFLWLLFHKTWRFSGLFFLWAGIVSYSRIYLGVHYPLDILTGALVGVISACLFYQILNLGFEKKQKTQSA